MRFVINKMSRHNVRIFFDLSLNYKSSINRFFDEKMNDDTKKYNKNNEKDEEKDDEKKK